MGRFIFVFFTLLKVIFLQFRKEDKICYFVGNIIFFSNRLVKAQIIVGYNYYFENGIRLFKLVVCLGSGKESLIIDFFFLKEVCYKI